MSTARTEGRYGSQSMAAPLRRVMVHVNAEALAQADAKEWHYGPRFDARKAVAQHEVFVALLDDVPDCSVERLDPEGAATGTLADAMFPHDPSLVTDRGAIILSMGKPLRADEPDAHARFYERAGMPIVGRIEAPGMVEGGDCVWLAPDLLVIGRGVRTNTHGIEQMRDLLASAGVDVVAFDLPLWEGREACLHLMSVISPLADDLALVHAPLMPVAFHDLLRERGITVVEGDREEFASSGGLNLNVLATAPREAIAVAGFPKTKAAMEAEGVTVRTFEADALCIACEGGPTCLTRPILRG